VWVYKILEVLCSTGFLKDDDCKLPQMVLDTTGFVTGQDHWYSFEDTPPTDAQVYKERKMYGGHLACGLVDVPYKFSEVNVSHPPLSEDVEDL
jgi:hypothetical protein